MNEFLIASLEIRLGLDSTYARQKAREIAELIGFDRNDQTRIATAVSEISRNAWQHAGGGTVTFALQQGTPQSFQIRVEDNGPGIERLDDLLTGRYGDNNIGGKSLAGTRSVMDDFKVETTPGAGTIVSMCKVLPRSVAVLDDSRLQSIATEFANRPPTTPQEELHRQNQDLLRALQEIQQQEANWERLYHEMEATNRDMLAVHDELSEQVQALSHSEARVRQMVSEVKDYAIFLLDTQGQIATWNVGAERTLGYTETEVMGKSVNLFLPADELNSGRSGQDMQAARSTGRVESEYWYQRKDGTRFFGNCVLTALSDDSQLIGYVKILRDITDRKQAEESLKKAYQRERHITEVLQSPLIKSLPQDVLPGLSVVTLYESALDEAEVGGDFFDAFPLADGRVVLAVGDASGKGLTAALRAMEVKQLLRAAFALVSDPSPVRVVTHLNHYVSSADAAALTEVFGFVTLSLVVLNPHDGQGISVSAGCEPPLLLRGTGEMESLQAPGAPLGVVTPNAHVELPFALSPQDTLILMTDGITEARNRRSILGYEGMIALAEQGMATPTLHDMGTVILEGAREFAGGNLRDDACLLLARAAPSLPLAPAPSSSPNSDDTPTA